MTQYVLMIRVDQRQGTTLMDIWQRIKDIRDVQLVGDLQGGSTIVGVSRTPKAELERRVGRFCHVEPVVEFDPAD